MLGVRMGQTRRGIEIQGFVNGSPAVAAGVQEGDLIIGIDGMEVRNRDRFADYVSAQRAGDVVEIKVRRGGDVKDLKVKLARWEDLAGGIRRGGDVAPEVAETPVGKPRLGVLLDRLLDVDGAPIHEVIEGSPAAEAGLRAGDIVVEIDGRPVADVAAMESIFGTKKPSDKISVKLLRGEEEKEVPVTLGER
jgi:serine protease Do